MSTQQALTVVGAVVGSYFGPAGSTWGSQLGCVAGSMVASRQPQNTSQGLAGRSRDAGPNEGSKK